MSSIVNDVLPALVPELDVFGVKWAISSLCFQIVIQGKELWGHFDRTSVMNLQWDHDYYQPRSDNE